jgi:hypothetical protein
MTLPAASDKRTNAGRAGGPVSLRTRVEMQHDTDTERGGGPFNAGCPWCPISQRPAFPRWSRRQQR